MPFPPSDRVIYGKNPLAEVICQFRFPTILRIGTEQPADFQDRVRADYPLYSLQEPSILVPQLPKELSAMLAEMNLRLPPGSSTHRFYIKDKSRSVSLSQDFLALSESHYLRWEDFRGEMVKAEGALQEVYHPSFYTRLGLRYKDVVCRSKLGLADVPWAELLQPHIVGELGAQGISTAVTAILTQAVIGIAEIPGAQVRVIHGLIQEAGTNEQCYLIDSDFFVEQKEGLSEPFDTLDGFNRLAARLFRWAVTDSLHRAMEPTPI